MWQENAAADPPNPRQSTAQFALVVVGTGGREGGRGVADHESELSRQI